MKTNKLIPGDRIAYAAKFLRDTQQHTGSAPQRRGTFLGYFGQHARVRWDDFEILASIGNGQYADKEYVEDARANGQLVHAANIARVGSLRFSHTA